MGPLAAEAPCYAGVDRVAQIGADMEVRSGRLRGRQPEGCFSVGGAVSAVPSLNEVATVELLPREQVGSNPGGVYELETCLPTNRWVSCSSVMLCHITWRLS